MQGYYHTRDTAEEYIRMAEGFDGKLLISELRKFLPANSSILELGMGPGTDLDLLKTEFVVCGSDFSSEFLEIYKKKNPDADLLNIDAVTLRTDRTFDAIYSNKVLHHLTDEELGSSFMNQYEILNSDGIVCHSFWKGKGEENYHGLLFNYHLEEEAEEWLGSGFETLLMMEYKESANGDSFLLIARKQ